MIPDKNQESIRVSLQEAVHADDDEDSIAGSMVTKFYVIIEVMKADGTKTLVTHSPDELTSWEAKGMLIEALDMERGNSD